jgi:urease accessory protein
MTIIERVYREGTLPATARGFARDTATLGWEERTRAHARRTTDNGVEFATSLPRGSVLGGGDCLVLDDERLVVVVVERLEPVLLVEPRSASEWALFAYHIGNRHQPLMISDEALVCPDLPGVEQVLQQHHMPYTRARRAFTPATAVAGHSH